MRRYDKPCRLTPGETVYAVGDGVVKRVTIQRMVGDGNAWTTCGDIVTPYRTFLSRAQADDALARAEADLAKVPHPTEGWS